MKYPTKNRRRIRRAVERVLRRNTGRGHYVQGDEAADSFIGPGSTLYFLPTPTIKQQDEASALCYAHMDDPESMAIMYDDMIALIVPRDNALELVLEELSRTGTVDECQCRRVKGSEWRCWHERARELLK